MSSCTYNNGFGILQNKDIIDGVPHSRPCFFAFEDSMITDIYWIVPISSKFEKFRRIEQDKLKKYGHCHAIRCSAPKDS